MFTRTYTTGVEDISYNDILLPAATLHSYGLNILFFFKLSSVIKHTNGKVIALCCIVYCTWSLRYWGLYWNSWLSHRCISQKVVGSISNGTLLAAVLALGSA